MNEDSHGYTGFTSRVAVWQVTGYRPVDFIYLPYEQSEPKCQWFYRQASGHIHTHLLQRTQSWITSRPAWPS